MEIRRVKNFRTIFEAGGLTLAAGLLHVTPGALSKSMRQLEREVGKALFFRAGRVLRLTERDQRLYHLSGSLIDEHARVFRDLDTSQPDQPTGPLRLASFEVFTTHCLGEILGHDLAGRPCQALETAVGGIEQAVEIREADIGVTYVPVPHRGLTFIPIGHIKFRIYVRHNAFTSVAFEELPFAIPTSKIDEALSDVLGIDCWPYGRYQD